MKKFKKIASLLLALVMVCAMSVTAFAVTTTAGTGDGTITITNAISGETYSVYKMLNLSYNTTTQSYSYTVATGWESFFDSQTGFTVDSDGYVTSTLSSNSSEMAAVAKAALAYAQENNISATAFVIADADGASINGLDLGYYLVDTTLGTLCSIDSTDTTAEIVEKNSDTPTEEKTVANSEDGTYGESNTASIGDTVYYKVELTNLANKSGVSLIDIMSDGLTLNTSSIKVTVGTTEYEKGTSTYSVTATASGYTITFTDDFLATLSSSDVVTVTYSAKINENAVIYGGDKTNTNSATLAYGTEHTITDITTTLVYDFDLVKVDDSNNKLTGAEFTLKDSNDNVITLVETSYGYRVATDDDETTTTTIVAGDVTVSGLAAGTYTLTETKAPTGYNVLSSPLTITINADGTVTYNNSTGTSVSVVNEAGSELPSTGGIGTTIFYVVGTIMVLGAVVVLITRKRMSAQ